MPCWWTISVKSFFSQKFLFSKVSFDKSFFWQKFLLTKVSLFKSFFVPKREELVATYSIQLKHKVTTNWRFVASTTLWWADLKTSPPYQPGKGVKKGWFSFNLDFWVISKFSNCFSSQPEESGIHNSLVGRFINPTFLPTWEKGWFLLNFNF